MTGPTPAAAGPPCRGQVLAAALRAAARGWPVFPVGAGKSPWIRAAHAPGHPCAGECGADGHGWRDATCDRERVRGHWWTRWPAIPGYGIATELADLVVIDLDTGKGPAPRQVLPDQGEDEPTPDWVTDGAGVLAWIAARDGVDLAQLLDTFTVATPSGGRHLYYAAPASFPGGGPSGRGVVRNSVGYSAGRITGLGWCIDVRAAGGYVLGPGSHTRIPDGAWGTYRVLPGPARPAPLPGVLAARLAEIGAPTATHGPGGVGAVGFPATSGVPGTSGAGVGHAPPWGVGGAGLPPVGGRSRFWAAAVAGELAHIAAAVPHDQAGGGRNATVNRAAYKLARLITPLRLSEADVDQVAAQLLAAGIATGLGEREASKAIASGLAQGRANPRTLSPPVTAGPGVSRPGGGRPPGRADPAGSRLPVRRPVPPKGS